MDPKIQQRIRRIQRAEQQCSDLIGALLLLSRNERGHGSSNVAKVAEQLLDSHRAQLGGKRIELILEDKQRSNGECTRICTVRRIGEPDWQRSQVHL